MIKAPISPGEYWDKVSILIRKFVEVPEAVARGTILLELASLFKECPPDQDVRRDQESIHDLFEINSKLWKLEIVARQEDREDHMVVGTIREIQQLNWERHCVKNSIADEQGEEIWEVKDYVV
jgi:hypothetical protein